MKVIFHVVLGFATGGIWFVVLGVWFMFKMVKK